MTFAFVSWQNITSANEDFAGLLFGPAEGASIGQFVRDLELIGKASNPEDWRNTVAYLPL